MVRVLEDVWGITAVEPHAITLSSGWTNQELPSDVNEDGIVAPLDAWLVINERVIAIDVVFADAILLEASPI